MADAAIIARDLKHSYGKIEVLKDLCMTVPRTNIFGLLGPSGCGKTTLLKCIIGRTKIKSGYLRVFGCVPGDPKGGIPGPRVGYMPQELALFQEFTLEETLRYFGRIFCMKSSEIMEKLRFLVSFLDLPEDSRILSTFSGGQQRRASLAAALLHSPQLLILDEPTVGVDPLLRQAIWDYLTTVAAQGNTTIIITTHYIEEARQANLVGLMRGGRLLAEASPQKLIDNYNRNSLEDVFLHLCVRDGQSGDDALILSHTHRSHDSDLLRDQTVMNGEVPESVTTAAQDDVPLIDVEEPPQKSGCARWCGSCQPPSFWAFYALLAKNMIKMKRNIPFLLFQFLLPVVQIVLFSICIGHDPQNLAFGVLNHDEGLGPIKFSNDIIAQLDTNVFNLKPYSNFSTAYDDVKALKLWGFVEMRSKFTESLLIRFTNPTHLTNETAEEGSLHLYLDMTNEQVAAVTQQKMTVAFEAASAQILIKFNLSTAIVSLPIQLEPPVYGILDPTFTDFMAPGIIGVIICFMATGLTALSFVMERKEGLLDRTYVAGVGSAEIFLAHIVTQFLVMMVQAAVLLIFSLLVFHAPCRGSVLLVILLTLFLGFYGMTLGFLISASCRDENSAIQMALGTVYPNMLLSGVIWPIEGMPSWLEAIAVYLPMTSPINALRSVMLRGLGLESLSVVFGFVASISWSTGLLVLTYIVLQIKG